MTELDDIRARVREVLDGRTFKADGRIISLADVDYAAQSFEADGVVRAVADHASADGVVTVRVFHRRGADVPGLNTKLTDLFKERSPVGLRFVFDFALDTPDGPYR